MNNVYSPLAIARYFLERGDCDHLDHLKIQKLVYLAYSWHMAAYGEPPLIYEQPQAWKYGPVFDTLYRRFRGFGRDSIPAAACGAYPKPEDPRTIRLLGTVKYWYGKQTGLQLSTLTHKKGTPWQKQEGYYENIDNHSIIKYYAQEEFKDMLNYLKEK